MRVKKRNGEYEKVKLDEITARIELLSGDLDENIIDPVRITIEVVEKITDGMSTSNIDSFVAEICHSKGITHPHYNVLASRLIISDHHKNNLIAANAKFSQVCQLLYNNTDQLGKPSPLVSEELYQLSQEYASVIDDMIDNDRDFLLDYFGFKTLHKAYLLKIGDKVIETPQQMFMRVAIGLWGNVKVYHTYRNKKGLICRKENKVLELDLDKIKETYDLLSTKFFTHATPTLYNAGTKRPQLFSCFEGNTLVDTLEGPKPIKDVEIGDLVVTHLGNVKKVSQIHKNPVGNRQVYELNIRKTTPLKVTGNHKLWTLDKQGDTKWKSVEDLENGDFIGIPNYNGSIKNMTIDVEEELLKIYEINGRFDKREKISDEIIVEQDTVHIESSWTHNNLNNGGKEVRVTSKNQKIKRFINIDEKFCRFLGIWYGDGHICTRKNKDGITVPTGIGITSSKDNTELIKFCTEIKEYFGIEPSMHSMINQNTHQILYNSKILGLIFENLYGKGFKGKKLFKEIYQFDTKLVVSFIEGLISSDGCVTDKGNIILTMANQNLIHQIYTLCRIHNFDISAPIKAFRSKLATTDPYGINLTSMRHLFKNIYKTYTDDRIKNLSTITNVRNQFSPKEHNGFTFVPYHKKHKISLEDDYVYTLGVEDDHSYSIGGIIAQNCFLYGMDDNIESIFKVLSDSAQISKWSGGIGIHVSSIRADGSYIRGTNGKSDGLVPLLRTYNETARYINQGGKRPGSFAMYLEPWHADVEDFLRCKINHGDENRRARDLFYAMWIPDLFMQRVKNNEKWSLMCPSECPGLEKVYGEKFEELYTKYESEGRVVKTVDAKELFEQMVTSQIETGTPYMLYKDAVNKKSNQKNIGTIRSSNLCVAPETRILTDKGWFPISSLENTKVKVWNGDQWSDTEVRKTGVDQKLISVTLSNGSKINCTEYHKFYIETAKRPAQKSIPNMVEAKDLQVGDKLIKHDLPVIHKGKEMKYAYTHGLFCSIVSLYRKYCNNFYLCGNMEKLVNYLEIPGKKTTNGICVNIPPDFGERFEVPINYSINSKLKWLEGVVDGSNMRSNTRYIQIRSGLKDYLFNIQLMLQTMGIVSKITTNDSLRERYCLIISSGYTRKLLDIGFSPKRVLLQITPRRDTTQFVKVVSIEDNNRTDDTYCFTEPLKNMGMFEGILLGNCAEITEYSDTNKYACCVLASVVLPTYVNNKQFDYQKLYEVVRVITRNLNRVIDINYYPCPETALSNFSERPIGIGVQGLQDVFYKLKLPYDSEEALQVDREIHETIYFAALTESCELAQKDGPYETFEGSPISQGKFQFDLWKEHSNAEIKHSGRWDWESLRENITKYGVRNSLVTALMPTASTSQIMGSTSEAFEPVTSNCYTRRTKAGEFILLNKYMAEDLISEGIWNESMRSNLLQTRGSLQPLNVPQKYKDIYKTVWELKQKNLIDHSLARGVYVDQSQSLNLYYEESSKLPPLRDRIAAGHFYGWRNGLKTGCYYTRSKPAVNSISFTVDHDDESETHEVQEIHEVDDDDCSMCGA